MPEEATETPAAEGENTSEETPNAEESQEQSEQTEDWHQRYTDLQSTFTPLTQELSELRQQQQQLATAVQIARDPEHPQYREAREVLGFEVDDEDSEFEDDPDALQRRLDDLEERYEADREAAEAAQYEAAEWDWIENNTVQLCEAKGLDPSIEELDMVIAYATANRLEDGQPDLEGALTRLQSAWDQRQKAYVNSKRAPQAPSGASASADIDMDDKEQRREYMLRRMTEAA